MKRMVTTLAIVTMLVLTAACSAQAENPELELSSEKPVVESNAADTKLVDTTTKFEANAEDPWAGALTPGLDYLTLVNRNHPYEFSGPYDRNLHDSRALLLAHSHQLSAPSEVMSANPAVPQFAIGRASRLQPQHAGLSAGAVTGACGIYS